MYSEYTLSRDATLALQRYAVNCHCRQTDAFITVFGAGEAAASEHVRASRLAEQGAIALPGESEWISAAAANEAAAARA